MNLKEYLNKRKKITFKNVNFHCFLTLLFKINVKLQKWNNKNKQTKVKKNLKETHKCRLNHNHDEWMNYRIVNQKKKFNFKNKPLVVCLLFFFSFCIFDHLINLTKFVNLTIQTKSKSKYINNDVKTEMKSIQW